MSAITLLRLLVLSLLLAGCDSEPRQSILPTYWLDGTCYFLSPGKGESGSYERSDGRSVRDAVFLECPK